MSSVLRWREPTSVDDLFLYRLARLQAVAGSMVVRLCEGRFGITRREWRLLLILAEQGPLQPSQLADQAQLDRTRTSRNITSLAQKKLIERLPCTGDGRRTILAVTESGRELHAALFPQVADINRALLAGLPDAEVDRLAHSLRVLVERAQAMDMAMDLPNAGRGLRRTAK